jgi:putative transposase
VPRPLRPAFAGAMYHVTTRGVARCAAGGPAGRASRADGDGGLQHCLIYTDDVDRARFLELLAVTVLRRRWRCHAYCLMGTHYHALVETQNADISAGLQYLNGRYGQWFNRRHRRAGHLFGARFGSELVETDADLLEASRYIARNPLRAGLCLDPLEWRWSSHGATVGAARQPLFLTVNLLLRLFSPHRNVARERYRAWVTADGDAPVLVAA